jgi:hypothetical protein
MALLPAWIFVIGVNMLPFLLIPAVMLIPGYLFRGQDPPPPDDRDGGPGGPPREPRDSPDRPRDGLPLPDAEPARVRVRDHRPARLVPRERGREPEPTPLRPSHPPRPV